MAIDMETTQKSCQKHNAERSRMNAIRPYDQNDFTIPRSALLRVLQGVAVATKSPDTDVEPVADCISSLEDETPADEHLNEASKKDSFTLQQWLGHLLHSLRDERLQHIAKLSLGVAYLRQHSRVNGTIPVDSQIMEFIWQMIYSVLTCPTLDPPLCSPVRSAQGFLAINLCSLIEKGNIDELFRLHVWLPDGKRVVREREIHSHQPFAQSWILAGEGIDVSYDVQLVSDSKTATHAQYALTWGDGKSLNSTYKTHQTVSIVANTGILVRATLRETATHRRDMTYSVPAAAYHVSKIPPDRFHSTFFFFDSHRGFEKDASVLGPVDGGPVAAHRDPAGFTADALAKLVQSERLKEMSS